MAINSRKSCRESRRGASACGDERGRNSCEATGGGRRSACATGAFARIGSESWCAIQGSNLWLSSFSGLFSMFFSFWGRFGDEILRSLRLPRETSPDDEAKGASENHVHHQEQSQFCFEAHARFASSSTITRLRLGGMMANHASAISLVMPCRAKYSVSRTAALLPASRATRATSGLQT